MDEKKDWMADGTGIFILLSLPTILSLYEGYWKRLNEIRLWSLFGGFLAPKSSPSLQLQSEDRIGS